jgi:hypothetical protein
LPMLEGDFVGGVYDEGGGLGHWATHISRCTASTNT